MGKRNNLGRRRNIWEHQVSREKERLAKRKKKKDVDTREKTATVIDNGDNITINKVVVTKNSNKTTIVRRKNNKRKLEEQQATDARDDDVHTSNTNQPFMKKRKKMKRNKAFYKKLAAEKSRLKNIKDKVAQEAAKARMVVD